MEAGSGLGLQSGPLQHPVEFSSSRLLGEGGCGAFSEWSAGVSLPGEPQPWPQESPLAGVRLFPGPLGFEWEAPPCL